MDLPENYDPTIFDRPSVTVDIVIFSLVENDLRVLLIKRDQAPYANMWAIPGSFIEINESLDAAAVRALADETGVTDVYMEQLYTFGIPNRDPRTRVITVAYFALVPYAAVKHQVGEHTKDAAWFSMYNLPKLGFDHEHILEYAFTRLRYKLEYTSVGFQLLPDVFTLTELQKAYEIILGRETRQKEFQAENFVSYNFGKKLDKRKKMVKVAQLNFIATLKMQWLRSKPVGCSLKIWAKQISTIVFVSYP